ncbi:MAG TPA: universal stress protein [Acidimicrobiales bacterium]|nr:universal stress protein [Acidimicrobiales bacterium]
MPGTESTLPPPGEPAAPQRVTGVLVPFDGSDFSRAAVPVATALAHRLDAEVHVLSVVDSVQKVEARQHALAGLDVPGPMAHREVVVDRDPAGAIHEALHKLDDAVICMATHGRARSAALLGSVASDVVARGRDPLVLVCPLVERAPWGTGVVACVDGGPASAPLVAVAARWSDLLGEPLTVLTVAEDAPRPVTGGPVRRRFGPDGDAGAVLDALAAPHREGGRDVATVVWPEPVNVGMGIEGYLGEHPAALVVTNTRSTTGLRRLILGSAAAAIVRHSPSPVLVVPLPAGGPQP